MNWIALFENICKDDKDYDLSFFEPITELELNRVRQMTGAIISGDLLALLKETNGIKNKRFGDFIVFNSEEIIKSHALHLEFLKEIDAAPPHHFLFFADNGCGEHFGFIVMEGNIISDQVGVYYPMENEFRIVAPDFMSWAVEWYAGRLAT